jgi:putative transposase
MKKSRFTETQIFKVLKEIEGGRLVKDVCREVTGHFKSLLLFH